LDIEQTSSLPTFDVILAANVIHATHLTSALPKIRSLLANNGVIVLLEVTRPTLFLDISFGLTEGWWRRGVHPLMSYDGWKGTSEEQGFQVSRVEDHVGFQSVIVAKKEGSEEIIPQSNGIEYIAAPKRAQVRIDPKQSRELLKQLEDTSFKPSSVLPQLKNFVMAVIGSTLDRSRREFKHIWNGFTFGIRNEKMQVFWPFCG
jgi:hypothetical protein